MYCIMNNRNPTRSPRSVLQNDKNAFYLTNGLNKSNNYPRYFSNYSLKSSKNTKSKLEFGKIYKAHQEFSRNTNLGNTPFPIFYTDDSIQNQTIFRMKFITKGDYNWSYNVIGRPGTPIEYIVYFKTRNSAERFHKHMLKTQNNYLYPNRGRIRKIQLNTKIYNNINEYFGKYNNSPFHNINMTYIH